MYCHHTSAPRHWQDMSPCHVRCIYNCLPNHTRAPVVFHNNSCTAHALHCGIVAYKRPQTQKMERRASIQFNSKFATTYGRLFQGVQPEELTGKKQDVASFWSQLLDLNVDRELLSSKLHKVRKDDCLGTLR
ncbi:hypothetical protein BD309DRAFT_687163 [Dichomitus squalens]|nr:hypothetical protein BD309DRAFT_687163 [Dichomitus squalens]